MRRAFRSVRVVGRSDVVVMAVVWRDSTFCRFISTVAILNKLSQVIRWDRTLKKRVAIIADQSLVLYQAFMGGVDRVDRTNAKACVQMHRCGGRYHRAIFWWAVGTFGHNNVKVLFKAFLPAAEYAALHKEKEHSGFGFFHWFQYSLAMVLIEKGTAMCREADRVADANYEDPSFQSHFIPRPGGRHRLSGGIAKTGNHEWEPMRGLTNTREVDCRARCKNTGCSKKTFKGCRKCKVALCSESCFVAWNHFKNAPPSPVVIEK